MLLQKRGREQAFTLLELSIVLTVISVVIAMSVTSGITVIESARSQQTADKFTAIKAALQTYRKVNNRLPCPGSFWLSVTSHNFGVEGPNLASAGCQTPAPGAATAIYKTAASDVVEGTVPVRTLGLPDDFAFDGWGNRIRYAVTTIYTTSDIFLDVGPGDTCFPAVKILDGTGASGYRTENALYALISHGPNSHGTYTRAGVLANNDITTNTDEQENCHCNSSGATTYDGTYVQKNATGDGISDDSFDDIVDYRMRWQMQTSSDITVTSGCTYLAVAHAASPYVYLYYMRRSIDKLVKFSGPTTAMSASGSAVDFSNDNTMLAVGTGSASPNAGSLYYTGNGLTFASAYMNNSARVIENRFSYNDTYLGMAGVWSQPYFRMYTRSGATYTTSGITINPANLPSGAYAVNSIYATAIAWRPDASEVYLVGDHRYLYRYVRSGNVFTLTDPQGTGQNPTDVTVAPYGFVTVGQSLYGLSFHPTLNYLAIATQQSASTTYYLPTVVKNIDSATPTIISVAGSGLTYSYTGATPTAVAWSPDGNYLAVSYYNAGGIEVYYFDSATDHFTRVLANTTACPYYRRNVAWSSDGLYLAATSDGTGSPGRYLCIFKRSGTGLTTTFSDITTTALTGTGTSVQPGGSAMGVTWSH